MNEEAASDGGLFVSRAAEKRPHSGGLGGWSGAAHSNRRQRGNKWPTAQPNYRNSADRSEL